MNKFRKGGKGVGRFIWLKAFERVLVQSIFKEGSQTFERSFVFSLDTIDGIQYPQKTLVDNASICETTIKMEGFQEYYEKECPRNAATIAMRIVEHCLSYFLLEKMPSITLHDDDDDTVINLWDIYSDLIDKQQTRDLLVDDHKFTHIHFLLHSSGDMKHHLSYCADNRVVRSNNMGQKVPNLPQSLIIDDQSYVYAGYILSDYLDKRVNTP